MNSYPHMCRDQHVEIGHSMSDDDERCPVCHLIDALEDAIVDLLDEGVSRHYLKPYEDALRRARGANVTGEGRNE